MASIRTFLKIRCTPFRFLHIPPAVIEYVDVKLADKDAAA
jgi:hypothetical protein